MLATLGARSFSAAALTWDQALFIYLFASMARELAREGKNNAWYIYLTSRQPPPNLHNLTSAWPVMLLANKRLPYGNQILARIMSLLKSILGKRKFLSTSMFRWRFLKKILNVLFLWWNTASWSYRTFIQQLQMIKNLLVKARWLRSVPKAVKKN